VFSRSALDRIGSGVLVQDREERKGSWSRKGIGKGENLKNTLMFGRGKREPGESGEWGVEE
jgi:hypothetical protein